MTDRTEWLPRLRLLAEEAAHHAYVPYSRYAVGAALLFEEGAVVTGCNVENLSYGLSICAERTAVFRAIAERGAASKIVAIAVTNLAGQASAPCGACRQVLHEFAAGDALVTYRTLEGWATRPFRELLPDAFVFEPPQS
jgi:cytidine deaminase